MSAGVSRETRRCGTFEGNVGASEGFARRDASLGTLRSREGHGRTGVPETGDLSIALQKMAVTSGWAAVGRGRSRAIRKNVIGHASPIPREQIREGRSIVGVRSALALVHEQAREHGLGIFLDPLLEERRNFLAEISGMAQAGEFKALERVAGSGEKKLPGELGFMNGHGGPPENDSRRVILSK